MAYNREGKIADKIINGPNLIEGVDYYPLESTYTKDKIMEDTKSSMEYWYDNYFLAYGFQTIRNNSLPKVKGLFSILIKLRFSKRD